MIKKLVPIIAAFLTLVTLTSCINNPGTLETLESTFESLSESVSESVSESISDIFESSESETENGGSGEIEVPTNDAYYIIEAVAAYGRNGLANGWKYDNRFEFANTTGRDANLLIDASDYKFFRLIRDFDSENDGKLKLEMIIEAQGNEEGVYVALCGKKDERVLYLTPKGGYWAFVGETELITTIPVVESAATTLYGIEMNVDLDQNTANVTINNTYCGEIKIPERALERLIIGTNKVGKGTIGFSYVRLSKNFSSIDRFILGDVANYEDELPANWSVIGDFRLDRIKSMRLYDMYSVKAETEAGKTSAAFKKFDKTSGVVSFETMILLPEKVNGAAVSMLSGNNKVITFETRDGKMYVGDIMVNDYTANVWQTLHVDADTNTGKAKIYVNGKLKATVDFEAEYFNGVRIDFTPDRDAVMWFDDVEVYEYVKHKDYPSTPQVAESTDYNVGMNVCWLWRDQQSGEGWDAVSPFMEFDTYLGYYDEGLRETADWELKWMAEHGVDFVHVCWYAPSENVQEPIKEMRHSYAALHDGYMMAEYSDLVDFCIMWENSNVDVYSLEQFKEYVWKYWCEYYFADERYATLDNKAVISIWSRENLEVAFGGKEGARAAMEWMEEDIKRYGYDGIVFLAQTQGQVSTEEYLDIANRGFDATYAYHWKERGQDESYQSRCNNYNVTMSSGVSHHIPTISIGFNDVGRNETRDPIVSVKGHYKVCASAKSLLAKLDTGTWKDNTVFLSTWNEYSEGTYMFPTASTGFDYLENVRTVFTSDTSDHSELDVMPTEAQVDRITHLYPDNHSPIRWYQFKSADTTPSAYAVKINGVNMSFTFNPVLADDGDIIVVGEASKGFYSMLRLFYEWDRYTDDGVLTLHTYDEHTIVLRVGSDKVTIDEKVQELGFTFELRDGLPQFHLGKLCALLGYKLTMENGTYSVQAATDEEYAILVGSGSGAWEFDLAGETMGWRVQQGSGTVTNTGVLAVTPTGNDVAIIRDISFPAGMYSVLRVGIKYNAEVMKGNATLYFRTQTHSAYGEDRAIHISYNTEGKGEGDTVELVFILENCKGYYGNITGIRIDPFTGQTPFEVDYVRFELSDEYCTENKLVSGDDDLHWDFEDGQTDGWIMEGGKLSGVIDGALVGSSNTNDPALKNSVNFRASRYQYMLFEMTYHDYMYGEAPRLYFTTESSPKWSDDMLIMGIYRLPADVKEGDKIVAFFDLSRCDNWKGTITNIRFDPFGVEGSFEIDSIKFCQEEGKEMTGNKATKPTEVEITDAENIPEGITVSGGNANVIVVEDPTAAGNKVFKVECTNAAEGGKVYTYFNLFMQFEPGEIYTVTYKIMPLTDMAGNDFANTIIGGNLRYGTTEAGSFKDHLVDNVTNKSTSSGWIELTFTMRIPANYSATENDCFQIWGKFSPQSQLGISYLVKDVSITLME